MKNSEVRRPGSPVLSRLAMVGAVISFTVFAGGTQSSNSQDAAKKHVRDFSSATFTERVVLSSQAIEKIRVGDCLDEQGRRPDPQNRIVWNPKFASNPDLRAGGHFVIVEEKEKPKFVKDDLGGYFEKSVLAPSIEVGVDLLPDNRQENGIQVTGRLWASYRGFNDKANIGFPQWAQFGLFGDTFSTSEFWGDQFRRTDLTPEQLARLTPCQVMTRAPIKTGDFSRTFFSLPIDMSADGDIEEFCNLNVRSIKRVWSSYQGPQAVTTLLWCRLGPDKKSVTIRQCTIEETLSSDAKFRIWKRKSQVESVMRGVGTRHAVANLSFKISRIVDVKLKSAWVHIADPEIIMTAPAR